jgi:hypothetical protein
VTILPVVADQREWTIPCLDGVGRPRELRVHLVGPDRLGIALPAGESATLDYQGTIRLLTAVGYLGGVMRHGLSDG